MNVSERIKMVRYMEHIARCINNENIFMTWLSYGVADGDIDSDTTDMELLGYVDDDETFAELMDVFLNCMKRAEKSGGLYCDDVVSRYRGE